MEWMLIPAAVLMLALVLLLLWQNSLLLEQVRQQKIAGELAKPTSFTYDLDSKRMVATPALADLFGGFSNNYSTMIQENFPQDAIENGYIYPSDAQRCLDFCQRLADGDTTHGQIELRIRNEYTGAYLWSLVTVQLLGESSKRSRKVVGMIQDLNYTDPLTGIDNKFKFEQDAQRMLQKYRGGLAFVLLDLKDFKLFNEIHGYHQGDLLLRHMADVVRACTSPDELCAHAFSDRFFLLWRYEGHPQIVARVEETIMRIGDYELSNNRCTVAAYAGIFVVNDGVIPINSIVDRARIAQLGVKASHKERVAFFDEDIKNTLVRRQELEGNMERSLSEGLFQVYVQPKYRLATGQIAGGEALVRWVSGKHIILPGDFIPLFEQNGFITQLDLYIFSQVCLMIRGWLDRGLPPVPVSVNFSRLHLYNQRFAKTLAYIAQQQGVPNNLLEIELTESIAFENETVLAQFIQDLTEQGFLVSVDDFGNGYSSLAMLKNLDFKIIKLDSKFFERGGDPQRTKAVVGNVIALSKQLDIITVAEGVETQEDIDLLRELGCDIVQGYYFSRPMPADEFTKKLALSRLAVATQ